MRRFLLWSAIAFLNSCATLVPPPGVDLRGFDPDRAWARVLERHVDGKGRIDFDAMAASSEDLDGTVAWLASERDAPLAREERLAELLNAYNALAMYNVLHAGVEPAAKVRFFSLRRLIYRGEPLSLYALENDVIRPLGEPRIHFALNCMVRSCPRLPRVAFRAEVLEAQLDGAAREFLNDPRHVQPLPEEGEVRLSAILDWYEEDFLAEAPSLLAYVNRYRDVPIPETWTVSFLSYDWTLNAKP